MARQVSPEKLAAWVSRVRWRLISVPIYVKVFGIGLLVSLLFASIAFVFMRNSILEAHYRLHGEKALSVALALALRLESGDISQESVMIQDINETMRIFPSVRYILVQDPEGRILSHGLTFSKEAPPDLMERGASLCASCHTDVPPLVLPGDFLEVPPNAILSGGNLRAYRRAEGLVLDVTVPIGDGRLGSVRLGVRDKMIARDLASVNRSILAGLVLCLLATVCSALLLTYLLNKPIRGLLRLTKIVSEGDFSVRAPVYSGDELGHLAVAFNRMTEGLAESRRRLLRADRLASIGQFAAGAAHEINNPLDGVMSCLARLQREPANLTQNMEYLEMIQHALKRVSGVIQRLLEYSQAREMHQQPEDVRTIIESVADFVRVKAAHEGVAIKTECPAALRVRCDRYHLEQALLNLALNGVAAIVAASDGSLPGAVRGTLTFRAAAAAAPDGAPQVRIDVADTGVGIPPENLDKVFEAFFTTKDSGKGTGLGLAIVKEIIEAHAGVISVESNVGQGTVFHVFLPAEPTEGTKSARERDAVV
jgi:two-component system NtrC family sensor kinase